MTYESKGSAGTDLEGLAPSRDQSHSVQFYETAEFLVEALADFIAPGLQAGRPALVVACEERFEPLTEELGARGIGAEVALHGRLHLISARSTLDSILVDGVPDPTRFEEKMGSLYESLQRDPDGAVPVVFGEMVDLLIADGNHQAALALEQLWNRFIVQHPLSLLCAYSLRRFPTTLDFEQFQEICGQHHHVLPTEGYAQLDDSDRLTAVTTLQQQAQTLRSEVERRHELEAQLEAALRDLAESRERERAARIEAESARRVRRDFLAVMSHELRTPLNAIAGYAELIELGVHGAVSAMQRDYLERIRRSQQRLLEMIDEILLYSRVESGSVRYSLEVVPVKRAVTEARAAVLVQAREKEVGFATGEIDSTLVVKADQEKLHGILVSLFANAVKFTPGGGGVTVTVGSEEGTVAIEVRDSGVGVPDAMLETIFQPFVQVDSRLTRQYEGVGLGLAISRRFAREMGGDLIARKVAAPGASFLLTLPRP